MLVVPLILGGRAEAVNTLYGNVGARIVSEEARSGDE